MTNGSPLIFDRNGTQNGSDITHSANTAEFTITQPGVYYAVYNGSAVPASGTALPASNALSMQLNGNDIAGAQIQNIFTSSTEDIAQSLPAIINVTSVPATLTVVSSGGTFNYSTTSMNIFRIGSVPS